MIGARRRRFGLVSAGVGQAGPMGRGSGRGRGRPGRPRLRRDGEPWWQVGLWLAALAASAVALAALAVHFVAPPWKATIVLAAAAHYLMWAAPVGLVAAAVRRWGTAGFALLATAAVVAVQLPPNLADGRAPDGPRLVVLQANLKVGAADPDAVVATVRQRHVDVLAAEELTVAEEEHLEAAGLPGLLPYRYAAPLPLGGGGLGIWSRYPLRDGRNWPNFELGVLTVQVATPGPDVAFVAVHITAPYPYPSGGWRREIARLKGVLPRSGPVIVAGDFNATTDHAQFRELLAHGYADAAEQSGAGYLPTYPNDRWFGPVVGIDHVLVRGGLRAVDARTLGIPGSDHRALLVRVAY